MIKISYKSNLYPNYVCDSILGIDLQVLKSAGITHIVFDLDKTLVHKGSNSISLEYSDFLKTIQKAGFTVIIGSNTRRDLSFLSILLDPIVVAPAGLSYKPFPSFYRRIIVEAGTSSHHIAMIGDHILNDTIGPNHAGFMTISVRGMRGKISPFYRAYLNFAFRHAHHSAK